MSHPRRKVITRTSKKPCPIHCLIVTPDNLSFRRNQEPFCETEPRIFTTSLLIRVYPIMRESFFVENCAIQSDRINREHSISEYHTVTRQIKTHIWAATAARRHDAWIVELTFLFSSSLCHPIATTFLPSIFFDFCTFHFWSDGVTGEI